MHASSGTTGTATVVYHTQKDIDRWTDLVARCLYMAGVRPSDVFQNMMSYGLFTGGLGLHYGAETIGVMVIPMGVGNSKRQITFLRQFGTTVAHIIPSYSLKLLETFDEMELDPERTRIYASSLWELNLTLKRYGNGSKRPTVSLPRIPTGYPR